MKIEIINPQHLAWLSMVFGLLVFANVPAASIDFALHQAVLDDDKHLVTRLLSKGAAIDEIGSRKYGYGSALHLAVREGHLEIAKLLLSRGAEVDVLDPDDFTPLHNAAWNGNLKITELLLDAGADINAITYDGDTPLSLAQKNDQTQVAEFVQTRLQASSVIETKVESTSVSDSGFRDVSGTYVMTNLTGNWFAAKFVSKPNITIAQNGDQLTGTYDEGRGKFWGEIKGDTIKLDWAGQQFTGYGKWTFKPGSNESSVTLYANSGVGEAKFNLTKIEVPSATDPGVIDISGTYIADISGDSALLMALLFRPTSTEVRKVIITQNGSQITGTYDDGKGKFYGDIEGDTIEFYWTSSRLHGGGYGKWTHVTENNELVGRFGADTGGLLSLSGEWNLTKIE
jgi:hypothetical protein